MRAKDQRAPLIRSLEDGRGARHYLAARDQKMDVATCGNDAGVLVAVKQLEIDLEGGRCHYNWKHLEADNGFLTDKPLHIDKNIVKMTRDAFCDELEG